MQPFAALEVQSEASLWHRLFLHGVTIPCRLGLPLRHVLLEDFGLSPKQVDETIDVYFLDGRPVDDLDTAFPDDGSRLALAAGLPGVAGIAMKRGSAVKGLRPGIAHQTKNTAAPGAGALTLALFSLALPFLAGHFLERGVVAPASLVQEICARVPSLPCTLDGVPSTTGDAAEKLAEAPAELLIRVRPA